MNGGDTNAELTADPATLALSALAWTLMDERRAQRLLDLTGLDADQLRARADDPAILVGTLRFLEAHEPDLVACAEEIECDPAHLVAARRELDR